MVAGGDWAGTTSVWSIQNATEVFRHVRGSIGDVVFSRDGKQLAASTFGLPEGINIWRTTDWKKIKTLILRSTRDDISKLPRFLSFSPDGKRILSGSADQNGQVLLWNVGTNSAETLSDKEPVGGTTFVSFVNERPTWGNSRDGVLVDDGSAKRAMATAIGNRITSGAVASESMVVAWVDLDRTVITFDLKDGTSARPTRLEEYDKLRAISPDGARLAVETAGEVRVLDSQSGKLELVVPGEGMFASVLFSPDSKKLYVATGGYNVYIWDIDSNKKTIIIHNTLIDRMTVQSTQRGITVAALVEKRIFPQAGTERAIRVWDGISGELIKEFSTNIWQGGGIRLSPDGRLAIVSDDRTVQSIALDNQSVPGPLMTSEDTYRLGFAPDEQLIGAIDGSAIRLWSANEGLAAYSFASSVGTLLDFGFSTDGKKIIALGSRGVEVLDTSSRRSSLQVMVGLRGEWLAVKPNGEMFATKGVSDQFQMLDAEGKKQILDESYIVGHSPPVGPFSHFFH
jgi:WD40 repeat protein